LLLAVAAAIAGARTFWPLITVLVTSFATAVALRDMVTPVLARRRNAQVGLLRAAITAFARGRRRYGGQIVHIGVALAVLAIGLSGAYKVSAEGVIDRGQSMTVGDYTLRFLGAEVLNEPHRRRTLAKIAVDRGGRQIDVLTPAMNRYPRQMSPIGSPAVRSTAKEDLYLSVMQVDPLGRFVGLRAYVNPAVAWLWIALYVMMLGCGVAVWPSASAFRRKRATESKSREAAVAAPSAPLEKAS
jgi:cytochrome c-type biogenesis protein CcmF